MIAVIFEFIPDPAHSEQYFDLAAKLRDTVEKVDGFISIERFQSLADENKFVSIRSGVTAMRWTPGIRFPATAMLRKKAAREYLRTIGSESPRSFAIMIWPKGALPPIRAAKKNAGFENPASLTGRGQERGVWPLTKSYCHLRGGNKGSSNSIAYTLEHLCFQNFSIQCQNVTTCNFVEIF